MATAPKVLSTIGWFVREGAGSSASTMPTFADGDLLGEVTAHSISDQVDKYVHRKCVSGIWVDSDVLPVGSAETFSLTTSELGAEVLKMIRKTNPTVSSGAATYGSGSALVHKGWVKVDIKDQAGNVLDSIKRWCEVSIDSSEIGGNFSVTLNCRKLYSTQNTGSWSNLP